MIPKTIHYCWFGGNPLPEEAVRCIESWRRFCPDYEIREWNESNFNIHKYKYAEQAYGKKKYAFVSDVARFDILFQYGGVYLDTDVELLRPIDSFLSNESFAGYDQSGKINTGLIYGSAPGNPLIKEALSYYTKNEFLLKNGLPNTTTVVTIFSDILSKHGYTLDGQFFQSPLLTLYPWDYFDPFDFETRQMKITENTHSIHHYACSWKSKNDMRIYKIGLAIKKAVGKDKYEKIARLKHKLLG